MIGRINARWAPMKLLVMAAVIASTIVPTPDAIALERLGLHFTKEELDIWKQRAANGPYKTKVDASTNSPGDWDRIISNANAFLKKPKADRWDGGYQGSGCVPNLNSSYSAGEIMSWEPHRSLLKIRDAAFVYRVSGDTRYKDAVKNELLNYYVGHPLIDFSNRSRWCLGKNSINDLNPGFGIAEGLDRVVFAYDFIKGDLTSAEQTKIETWLRHMGDYFRQVLDQSANSVYRDRKNGILRDPAWKSNYRGYHTHDGGYPIPHLTHWYNNRRATMAKFVADVGVLLNNQNMMGSARLFFKEWLKYSVFPDGTHGEYYRNSVGNHESGFGYTMSTVYAMLSVADVFARAGDPSLYKFVTSDGIAATKGGNKSLLLVMQNISKYIDGTFKRYLPGKAGQANFLIDGKNGSWISVFDIYFSRANVYYRDQRIKNTYLRKQSGVDPYPSKPATAGPYPAWQGTGGTLPGVLFMFGDMEGKVWPYPSGDSIPSPPTNLVVEVAQ